MLPAATKKPPRQKPKAHRAGMNKTGARILGGFVAALIAWIWGGWGEPATGVPLGDAMATTLGGACIVWVEWVLVKE